MGTIIQARPLVPGEARGIALVGQEPLSFWGGYDQLTGEIIDRRHELSGATAKDRILVLPGTRGSSTTTAVLLEAIQRGTAPAALLTLGVDAFLSLAAVVAEELFRQTMPVLALGEEGFRQLRTGQALKVRRDGTVEIFVYSLQ